MDKRNSRNFSKAIEVTSTFISVLNELTAYGVTMWENSVVSTFSYTERSFQYNAVLAIGRQCWLMRYNEGAVYRTLTDHNYTLQMKQCNVQMYIVHSYWHVPKYKVWTIHLQFSWVVKAGMIHRRRSHWCQWFLVLMNEIVQDWGAQQWLTITNHTIHNTDRYCQTAMHHFP